MVSINFPSAEWGLGYHVSRALQTQRGSRRKTETLETIKVPALITQISVHEWLVTVAVRCGKGSSGEFARATGCTSYKTKKTKTVCEALSNP